LSLLFSLPHLKPHLLNNNTRSQPAVVVFDRGSLDVSAYVPPELWSQLITKVGVTHESCLDSYDIICHLVTAADGAEQYYVS
jgi:hypothetical protein